MITMNFTFDQLRDSVQECTGYDLLPVFDDEHDSYILVDPYGDQDGDPFDNLEDVYDYISNNDQVNEYLKTEFPEQFTINMKLDQSTIDFLYSIPHSISISIPLYRISHEISEDDLLYYLDLIGMNFGSTDLYETFNLDNDFDLNDLNQFTINQGRRP